MFWEGNFASKIFGEFLANKMSFGKRKEYWEAKMFWRKDMGSQHFLDQIIIFNGFSIELVFVQPQTQIWIKEADEKNAKIQDICMGVSRRQCACSQVPTFASLEGKK